jgi:hypothetical protein
VAWVSTYNECCKPHHRTLYLELELGLLKLNVPILFICQ